MQVMVTASGQEFCAKAANQVAAVLTLKPDAVLGLATGETPGGMYEELAARYQRGEIDFSACSTVNLDEYCGLAGTDAHSYRYYMDKHLFERVNIRREHTHLPDGMAADVEAECRAYDALLDQLGGMDLLVLGIGHDGHIGFNEPGSGLTARTHCAELAERTVEANQRFFERREDVPRRAITLGIADIMAARRIMLLASGADKAEAVRAALTGPVTTNVPASLLQLHPRLTVILDSAAASTLPQ